MNQVTYIPYHTGDPNRFAPDPELVVTYDYRNDHHTHLTLEQVAELPRDIFKRFWHVDVAPALRNSRIVCLSPNGNVECTEEAFAFAVWLGNLRGFQFTQAVG